MQNIQKSYVFVDLMYIFSENGSCVPLMDAPVFLKISKEISRLISKGMSNIYLHSPIEKNERSLEAVTQRCSVRKVFLEFSQNSQENTCARVSFLIKLLAWPVTLLKKRLQQSCFPVNFAKFLRTSFLT